MTNSGNDEISASVELMQRVDLDNLLEARQLMGSEGLDVGSAEERYGPRVVVEDHQIDTGSGEIDARVYRPAEVGQERVAVLLLHGGAFVGGDLATEHARSLRFAAEAGCVVISPAYRLAPEHSYPHGLLDCYAVLEWIAGHADALHISTQKLVVAGVSAGGALAAALSLMVRDRGGPSIRAQMLLYPVLDDRMATVSMLRFIDTPVWDAANSQKMWRLYLGNSNPDAYAAPARAESLRGLPPTYLLIAEIDPLRDEALEFGARLLSADVPVDIRLWAGGYHVFDQLLPDAKLSALSLADQISFIRRLG